MTWGENINQCGQFQMPNNQSQLALAIAQYQQEKWMKESRTTSKQTGDRQQ